jgi:hypothetical protein
MSMLLKVMLFLAFCAACPATSLAGAAKQSTADMQAAAERAAFIERAKTRQEGLVTPKPTGNVRGGESVIIRWSLDPKQAVAYTSAPDLLIQPTLGLESNVMVVLKYAFNSGPGQKFAAFAAVTLNGGLHTWEAPSGESKNDDNCYIFGRRVGTRMEWTVNEGTMTLPYNASMITVKQWANVMFETPNAGDFLKGLIWVKVAVFKRGTNLKDIARGQERGVLSDWLPIQLDFGSGVK